MFGCPHLCRSFSQPYLELSAGSGSFRLRKDRIAHNTIGFEVGAGLTGQVLAYGTIRFDDLYQIVKDLVQKSRKEDGDEEDTTTAEDGAPSVGGSRLPQQLHASVVACTVLWCKK